MSSGKTLLHDIEISSISSLEQVAWWCMTSPDITWYGPSYQIVVGVVDCSTVLPYHDQCHKVQTAQAAQIGTMDQSANAVSKIVLKTSTTSISTNIPPYLIFVGIGIGVVLMSLSDLISVNIDIVSSIGTWWGMYASVNWAIIGSGNGLYWVQHPAITSTNADLPSIRLPRTHFN